MTKRVLKILRGHEINSFHIFLFPNLISPHQLTLWDIPYGVAAELMLHAEGFYIHLLNQERMNASPEV
jgi:hypothetical protein